MDSGYFIDAKPDPGPAPAQCRMVRLHSESGSESQVGLDEVRNKDYAVVVNAVQRIHPGIGRLAEGS